MRPIIEIENISKQYRLGTIGTGSLGDDLNRWWARVRGKEDPYLKIGDSNDRSIRGISDYVWALQDINFTVKQGDVLGIIGGNGAGKSTLLKIMSRVTTPTTGTIKARGRIASLLEVGTGFHPELTGRENIFLNGAILGMKKGEIRLKFDEIVDFSGCERYIDTPVKRYSSGMYVRLAFAVAAHLEPDILIIDEVLAVGDAEFQKKAIGKMQDVSKGEGKTILFVSHNMAAIKELCFSGLILQNGKIHKHGNINDITDEYIKGINNNLISSYCATEKKTNGYFLKIQLFNDQGENRSVFSQNENPYIIIEYIVFFDFNNYNTGINVRDIYGTHIYATADSDIKEENIFTKRAGKYKVKIPLKLYNLNTGTYKLEFLMGIVNIQLFDKVELSFSVENNNYLNYGIRPGLILSINKWEYI